jgi:hypothetical protein
MTRWRTIIGYGIITPELVRGRPAGYAAASAALLLIAASADQRITPAPHKIVRNMEITNSYRLFDDRKGVSSGSRFESIDAVVRRGGFRFRGNAHDILIRNVTLRLAAPTPHPELPAGIEIQGTAHDIVIDHVAARDFRMIPGTVKYLNGDGFSSERGAYRITFLNTSALNNSDGGYDLKSRDTRLANTLAARNKRNYRFWGTGRGSTVTSIAPRQAHIWLAKNASWRIRRLVARSAAPAPIVDGEGPSARLIVESCTFAVPRDTRLVTGKVSVTWGKGCTIR